jgi:hypothetical protein
MINGISRGGRFVASEKLIDREYKDQRNPITPGKRMKEEQGRSQPSVNTYW